jgi:putative serine protease PepD
MQRIFIFALATSVTSLIAAEVPEAVRDLGKAATVKVISDTDQQFGSGVVIGQGGSHTYLLTACHIVPTAKKVDVKVPGGKTYTAEVLERSPETDLAVLRLPTATGMPSPLKLATSRVKPMNSISIGWEKGDAPTVLDESLKGKVKLKKPGETNAVLCWEVGRKPASGRSGGPLLDESGLVLGIASGHDGATGYYVHIEAIHSFLAHKGLKWLTEEERQ